MSITLAASKKALEGAEAKARELGLNITTAVVDTGGVLVGLSRMDGARWMTVHIAVGKAKGSVAYSKPTSELAERAGRPVSSSLAARTLRAVRTRACSTICTCSSWPITRAR